MSLLDEKKKDLYSNKKAGDVAGNLFNKREKAQAQSEQNEQKKFGFKTSSDLAKESEKIDKFGEKWGAVKDDKKPGKVREIFNKIKEYCKKNKELVILFGVLGAVLIGLLIWFLILLTQRNSFDNDLVEMEIQGPLEVTAGETATYEVIIKNDSEKSLDQGVIKTKFPDSVKFIEGQESESVEKIKGKTEFKKQYQLELYDVQGQVIDLEFEFDFKPEGHANSEKVEADYSVNITATPVSLVIDGPQEVTLNSEWNIEVSYNNVSSTAWENLALQVTIPDGFDVVDRTSENFAGQNTWDVSKLDVNEKGSISLTLKASGQNSDEKKISATLGKKEQEQGEEERIYTLAGDTLVVTVVSSQISVEQKISTSQIEKVAGAGETIKYNINFTNNSEEALSELILKVEIAGEVVNYTGLDTGGGYYNDAEKSITWSAASAEKLKLLSPKDTGSVSFSVNVREDYVPLKANQKTEYTVKTATAVTTKAYPDNIIGESTEEVKIRTDLNFKVVNYHTDPSGRVDTCGSVPPKVGQETCYVIVLTLDNTYNNAEEVKVILNLAEGVEWTSKTHTTAGQLDYNDRTKELTWNVGQVSANTGTLLPAYEAVFQIKITPGSVQIGNTVDLVKSYKLYGKDSFTGVDLGKDESLKINTGTIEDGGSGDGEVTS